MSFTPHEGGVPSSKDYQTRTFFNEADDGILQVQCQLAGPAASNKLLKVTLLGGKSEIAATARATPATPPQSTTDGPTWSAAPSLWFQTNDLCWPLPCASKSCSHCRCRSRIARSRSSEMER